MIVWTSRTKGRTAYVFSCKTSQEASVFLGSLTKGCANEDRDKEVDQEREGLWSRSRRSNLQEEGIPRMMV